MTEQVATSAQWVSVEIDAAAEQKFGEIMPPGRTLDCLHIDPETGTLRVTLDNGAEIMIPVPRN